MNLTKFNFNYCCADKFRTIYRKLMSTYKKQYGRKVVDDLIIRYTENYEEKPAINRSRMRYKTFKDLNLDICTKCCKMYYENRDMKVIKYKVKMEVLHGI